MRNKAFKKLSPAEKELKILGALDKKTDGLLLPHEHLGIARELPRHQQYTIQLYRSNTEYWRVLSLDRTIRIRAIMTPKTPLDAAAVISWSKSDPTGTRQLHIFVPPTRPEKGKKPHEQQRISAACGL